VVIELEPEAAPKTVENFLAYVKEGFYTGTIFHRVIPSFMVQGGGFTENLQEKPAREPIPNEADLSSKAGLLNNRGTVAMARTQAPNSASAQFFINTVDNPKLDYQNSTPEGFGYCVFGRVVDGMEAVSKIEKVITVTRRGMTNVPEFAVRIKSAEVLPSN
jgi:cyclophilin family peptidyl-prolyl cis-trans isomerase